MKQPLHAPPPRQIFEKIVNKNAIKSKIGGPFGNFVKKALAPRDFGKNLSYPHLPRGFSTVCIYDLQVIQGD
jgi:hypothetical protein